MRIIREHAFVFEKLLLAQILEIERSSLSLIFVCKGLAHRLGHLAVDKNIVEQNQPVPKQHVTIG